MGDNALVIYLTRVRILFAFTNLPWEGRKNLVLFHHPVVQGELNRVKGAQQLLKTLVCKLQEGRGGSLQRRLFPPAGPCVLFYARERAGARSVHQRGYRRKKSSNNGNRSDAPETGPSSSWWSFSVFQAPSSIVYTATY